MSPDPPGLTTSAEPSTEPDVAAVAVDPSPVDEPAPVAAAADTDAPTQPSVIPPAGLAPSAPLPPPTSLRTAGVDTAPAVPTAEASRAPGTWALTSPRQPKVRRRARRVTRVIRRIDLWSVLKLALVLYTCLYAATLAALATLWAAAYSTGLIDNLQSFLGDVGLDNFRFYGDQMFRACAAIGAVLVLTGTLITVLTVALVNLISELTGGIRIVVIEEEPWSPERERVAVAEAQPLPSDAAAGL